MNLQSMSDKLVQEQPLIIVEGKKDKAALQKLGLHNIVVLKGMPIYKVVEQVAAQTNECLILTDLDSEGKKLYSKLKKDLQWHKVKVDDKFRNFLFKETTLKHIEGIDTYVLHQEIV